MERAGFVIVQLVEQEGAVGAAYYAGPREKPLWFSAPQPEIATVFESRDEALRVLELLGLAGREDHRVVPL